MEPGLDSESDLSVRTSVTKCSLSFNTWVMKWKKKCSNWTKEKSGDLAKWLHTVLKISINVSGAEIKRDLF